MTEPASPYGWSGLDAAGKRIFVPGPAPASPALTAVATYATKADFAAARRPAPDLAQVRADALVALDRACAAAITGGFTSSALGAAHTYGSSATSQANLDTAMMAASQANGASYTATIMCSADGTTWSRAVHNNTQIAQVWTDFQTWLETCLTKKDALVAQLAAATTVAAVAAISWS